MTRGSPSWANAHIGSRSAAMAQIERIGGTLAQVSVAAEAKCDQERRMASQRYLGMEPKVHPLAWVDASAQLLGDVVVGEEASVWPGAVMRGDNGAIHL